MHKPLIVVLPLVLVVGGLAVAQTPPTATEAFNLRIRCKQMADQKADEVGWHDMTVAECAAFGCTATDVARMNDRDRPEVLGSWSSSKYDATNNRCYVRIYRHIRRTQTPQPFDYEVQAVYDAQVDDLLANADIKNGKKNGNIWDQSYKGNRSLSGEAGWDAAVTYMDEMMADPRK